MKYMMTVLLSRLMLAITGLALPEKLPYPNAGQALAPFTGDTLPTILIVVAASAVVLVLLGMIGAINKRRRK